MRDGPCWPVWRVHLGPDPVSRLAANIPLVRHNLGPLSFIDTPPDRYIAATLAVYEETQVQPLAELFAWAYERSCQRYSVLRDALPEPAPVHWTGAVLGRTGEQLSVELPTPAQVDLLLLGVRATTRTAAGRAVLVADHRIRLPRPELIVDETRTRVAVRDQHGQPGSGLPLPFREQVATTDRAGIARFDEPLPPGAQLLLEGQTVLV